MTPEINLLPKIEKKKVSSQTPFLLLATIVILSLVYLVYTYFTVTASIKKLELEYNSSTIELEEQELALEVLINLNKGSLQDAVDFVRSISYLVTPLMDEIQKLQPPNTYLRDYNFSENKVEVILDFETMQEVSLYVERLVQSDYFTDAQVQNVASYEINEESSDEMKKIKNQFEVIPRYTLTISCLIDYTYLAGSGA